MCDSLIMKAEFEDDYISCLIYEVLYMSVFVTSLRLNH